jgi:hypothetical protein
MQQHGRRTVQVRGQSLGEAAAKPDEQALTAGQPGRRREVETGQRHPPGGDR